MAVATRVPCLRAIIALLTLVASRAFSAESIETNWRGGDGRWTEPNKWTVDPPTQLNEAAITGHSLLTIPAGDFAAARLAVGCAPGSRVAVELNGGGLLVRQDSLVIGEYTDSQGTFMLNSGVLQSVMDVFVGGATASTGRMNRASLIIRGGSFLGLTLTVGEGLGAESLVSIEGSRPAAVHAMEFVLLCAHADPSGKPGHTTLAFTLDQNGVTPITIGSTWKGLEIEHDPASHCGLSIRLSAVPPRDDITLVAAHVATRGIFDDLPEGAEITADFADHTYRWTLTYHGGKSGHDVVLRNMSAYAPDAPITHTRAIPLAPEPLWKDHPVFPLNISPGTPAFTGAEGYGASSLGGAGGQTWYVENLNDSGPGSLRAAVEAPGPRTILFRVGGILTLNTPLVIKEPFLTIDGENAPAPGLTLRRHGIEVRTHDVVLRHFRIRIGDDDVKRNDRKLRYAAGDGEYALSFEGARNCIADHLSLSWSTNKLLSTTKFADLITVQWCILSESLNLEGHGYASIAGGNRVTWHHNLFAHNFSRNARFQGAVDADFRNNVIYDWGEKSAYGEFDRLNYVGNYLKPGPSTSQKPRLFHDGVEAVLPGSLFLSGNIIEGDPRATDDNWKGTRFYYTREIVRAVEPFPAPPVKTETAKDALVQVLREVGATLPERDAVDTRIIQEVRDGTGQIIESVDQAGGWPKPKLR